MSVYALFIAVFLACLVEAVEATTIVVAAGMTRNWQSTLIGAGSALIVLAVAVIVLGPSIMLLPIYILRTVVGSLLLIFGLQWVKKAILRASGMKSLHDEKAIYERQVAAAKAAKTESKFGISDWYAFTLSFKGALLEGLEVVFIVLTFATNDGHLPVALLAAGLAILLVVTLGAVVRGPLSRIPENTLKFCVGILLITFGMFWGGEGVGANWPGSDTALLVIAPVIAVYSLLLVWMYSQAKKAEQPTKQQANAVPASQPGEKKKPSRLAAFGLFWYDFIIGDDWQIAAGVAITFIVLWMLHVWSIAWLIAILGVVILIPYGSYRAAKQ